MKNLTVFERDSAGKVKKAEWRRGSIFISYSAKSGSQTNETFVLNRNPDCQYLEALNLKNAMRKFKTVV